MRRRLERAVKKYKNFKLRDKMVLWGCLILMLSIFSLALVIRYLSSYFISNIAMDYTMQIVEQLNSNIESQFESMNTLAEQILYDADVFEYLRETQDTDICMREQLDQYYKIQSKLESILMQNAELSAISLYAAVSEEVVAADKEMFGYSHAVPPNEEWYWELLESKDYGISIRTVDENAGEVIRYGIARKIKDNRTKNVIGVIIIEAPIKTLASLLGDFDFGINSVININDQNGNIVYSSDSSSALNEISIHTESACVETIKGEKFLVSTNFSEATKWTVNCLIPMVNIVKEVSLIYPVFLLVGSIDLLLTIMIFFAAAGSLTRPLGEISAKMHEISSGMWDISIPVESRDEIGMLIESFNRMSEEIKILINDSYVKELQKQQFQLKMLHAQINPHFLYNSIEVIQMKALENEDYEVLHALTYLGKFMRLKLNTSTQQVLVREEVEHIIGYYKLIELCRRRVAELVVEIDPVFYERLIPKLSLQPLIENAMEHAFLPNQEGRIILSAEYQKEYMIFYVSDNGSGMDKDHVLRLQSELLGESEDGNHIGLKNIARRLRLIYGDAAELKIMSEPGKGTTMAVRIPDLHRKEEEEHLNESTYRR